MFVNTMKHLAFILTLLCGNASAADTNVLVLEGSETNFLRDALKRIECPFVSILKLEASALTPDRILILSGKEPPLSGGAEKLIEAFLQKGGNVLALGGGAKWMLDAKLFDASGYYPTGSTIHQSTFEGYHPVTFGYPMETPYKNWSVGVPMLLRATDGPLMRTGPRAVSILSAGGPFSLAAFQRIGKGIALLIGADPQGGHEFLSLEKPTLTLGDELKTDLLLANSVAWLREQGCNLIPNSGFEENAESGSDKSHWEIVLRNNAKSQWQRKGAPEGNVFLELEGTKANSSAAVSTFRPIVVGGETEVTFSFRHKGTGAWKWEVAFLPSASDDARPSSKQQPIPVAGSSTWKKEETSLRISANAPYITLTARFDGIGSLSLDEITLKRASREVR
jgi:hypothetical protein